MRLTGPVALIALALAPGPVSAQQLVPPPEAPPIVAPGWTITPSVGAAASWDDNVALTSPQQGELADQVTTALTSLTSRYRGRRGEFLAEYRGMYDFYRRYTAFNAPDHRGRIDFERRLGRRVTGFARDSFSSSPTTEVPFTDAGLLILRRRTTSTNDFRTGVEITPWTHSQITASYGNQWIDLLGDEQVQPLLRGGYAHVGELSMRRQLWHRLAVGGRYDLQHAIVSSGQATFQIQRAEGLLDYAISPALTLSGSFGWAWQTVGPSGDQSAPSFSADLRYHVEHATWSIGYERTYLASFGFGGTVQNRELRASVESQLSKKIGITGRLTASENDPLIAEGLDLRGLSGEGFITFGLASWLHLETFVVTSLQDTQLAGGRINRTRAGVRLLTLYPMRLR